MSKISPLLLGLSLVVAGSSLTTAQQTPSMPKVLQITREFIKPGKAGAIHDRSESAFVQAMARARWPTRYIALSSLSGRSRALYITAYDSFAAWQKDNDAVDRNKALLAELNRAGVTDGGLLDSFDQMVFYYEDDLSLRPQPDLSHVRYFEITAFHLRPGHHKEWTDLVKMVIAAHLKAGTNANWAMYELEYGGGDDYTLFSADTSMADIDEGFAEGKKFREAMGEEGMKKLEDLVASTVESVDSELFAINPRQSYPPDDWVKANPDFWKPKPVAAPVAKTAPIGKMHTP